MKIVLPLKFKFMEVKCISMAMLYFHGGKRFHLEVKILPREVVKFLPWKCHLLQESKPKTMKVGFTSMGEWNPAAT